VMMSKERVNGLIEPQNLSHTQSTREVDIFRILVGVAWLLMIEPS
jgi:hypothetical protein